MSIWAAIKKAVNSNLNTPLDFLIGQRTDAASASGSLHAKSTYIKNIVDALNARPPSAIKSIQRGITTMASDGTETTVTISAVNTGKSFLLFSVGANVQSDEAARTYLITGNIESSTTIKFTRYASRAGVTLNIAWQVIEYN